MSVRIAINGFGRIGRLFLRSAATRDDFEFVAINDLTTIGTLTHLLKYDSTHGRFPYNVKVQDNFIIIEGNRIEILSESDPENLPWSEMNIDVVVECTGRFRKRQDAAKHLKAGAKKVIISAPATDPDWTVVMGVNHLDYDDSKHQIISNASCTTNCLAPVAKVLVDNFGVEQGIMTTIHSYTNDQSLLDAPHKDLRRARSGAISMIPTTTGAAKAVSLVLPELKGKLAGLAVRVPTPNVSLVDLVAILNREVTKEEINQALKSAADGQLKDILDYTDEPLVSIDFNTSEYSGIVDGLSTIAAGKQVKILAWYDNEMGYSCRIRDLITYIYNL